MSLKERDRGIGRFAANLLVVTHDITNAIANTRFEKTFGKWASLMVDEKLESAAGRHQRERTFAGAGQVRIFARHAESGIGPSRV